MAKGHERKLHAQSILTTTLAIQARQFVEKLLRDPIAASRAARLLALDSLATLFQQTAGSWRTDSMSPAR